MVYFSLISRIKLKVIRGHFMEYCGQSTMFICYFHCFYFQHFFQAINVYASCLRTRILKKTLIGLQHLVIGPPAS